MRSFGSGKNQSSIPSARSALTLLLLINLFNYVDRQVLAAIVGPIKKTFFNPGAGGIVGGQSLDLVIAWFQNRLGFKPEDALLGLLGTAFMLIYMVGAPISPVWPRKSRWGIVGLGVILWSMASGAWVWLQHFSCF